MMFGRYLLDDVVRPNVREHVTECKPIRDSYLEGKVSVVYVDPSALLALLKMESCRHTKSYAAVADCFDMLSEKGAEIIFSGLCINQTHVSIARDEQFPSGSRVRPERYFELVYDALRRYPRARIGETTKMSRRLIAKLHDSTDSHRLLTRIEDYVHLHIARHLGADTILTYDPVFLWAKDGDMEITSEDGKLYVEYKERCGKPSLNVASPEAILKRRNVCV